MYTYIFTKLGFEGFRNFENLEDAVESAIIDYEWDTATPREIRSNEQIILNQKQIIRRWYEHFKE